MISSRRAESRSLVLVAALFTTSAFAAEYYVSPQGDDSNSGTHASEPWRTIAKANDTLKAGDVVYLRGGRFINDPIRPSRSGTAGSEIRYVAYQGETPVLTSDKPSGLTVAIDLTDRSYITVDGVDVDGVDPAPNARVDHFVNLYGANYNTIANGTFRYATGWHGIRITYEAHHNKLLDNVIEHVGTYDDGNGDDIGDAVQILRGSHHNLVQGNHFSRAAHNLLQVDDSTNNVITDNVFENDWSELEGPGKGGRNLSLMGEYNLFEHNIVRRSGASSDAPSNMGMKTEGRANIVRRNFIYANSNEGTTTSSRASQKRAQNNRIFHNTFFSNGGPAWGLNFYDGGDPVAGNVFKNNIVTDNRRMAVFGDADIRFRLGSNPTGVIGDSVVEGNLFAKGSAGDAKVDIKGGGDEMSLDAAAKQYPKNFRDNIQAVPIFVASDPREPEDFELTAGSPGVDQAVPLTRTKSGNSGTVVAVEDAGYFSDGFGLIPGDRIQIGDSKPLLVMDVDYSAHTLTVSEHITWQAGAPVSLEFQGAGPDIGANEQGAKGTRRQPKPPRSISASPH